MVRKLLDGKMNNKGSALLTVVLVVAFLTILATTLLYVSGMNFQTKQADYQNKKSFYSGEEALEEIRANLMEDASEAALLAYNDIMMNYDALRDGDYRTIEYYNAFVTRLQEVWVSPDPLAPGDDDWLKILNGRFAEGTNPTSPYILRLRLGNNYLSASDGHTFTSAEVLDVHNAEGFIRITGLQMVYVAPDTGRATIITTDLDVRAPEINWYVDQSEKSLPGVDAADIEIAAARKSKNTVDVSKCVKYANWKKE